MFRNIKQYSIRIIFVSSFKFCFVYTNFVPPVVQNMPKMTKFGLETPSKFDVHIL